MGYLNRATARLGLVVLAVVALLVGIVVANTRDRAGVAATGPAPVRSTARLGVFLGTSPQAVESFGRWLGRRPDYVNDFKPAHTWSQIADPEGLEEWTETPYRLVYGVPMLPDLGANERIGASGAYDRYFTQLARHLVSIGEGDAILRIGWEFNLVGWPWHAKDPLIFIRYWRHIVTAMRAVPGQHFQFDWNPDANGGSDASYYYPGNAYVDYIGVDAYDESWDSTVYPYPAGCDPMCHQTHQEEAWKHLSLGDRGLYFWADFARTKGRPLSIPEWGMWGRGDGRGGKDDPFYVDRMFQFISNPVNNVAYQSYFDFDEPTGTHTLQSAMPTGGEEYRQLFGS